MYVCMVHIESRVGRVSGTGDGWAARSTGRDALPPVRLEPDDREGGECGWLICDARLPPLGMTHKSSVLYVSYFPLRESLGGVARAVRGWRFWDSGAARTRITRLVTLAGSTNICRGGVYVCVCPGGGREEEREGRGRIMSRPPTIARI